jgi:hypothetical protein
VKTIFSLVLTASIALLQPAQGGSRGSGHGRSFAPAQHSSASAGHYSGGSRNFSAGGARYYHSSPRYSSQASFRNRNYSASSSRYSSQAAFRNRAYLASSPRFSSQEAFRNRTSGQRLGVERNSSLRSRGFNNNNRIIAQHSANQHPNWDRGRDHFWHGHRCHWRNNAWVIFGAGFYPWGYGYYPYGPYSYYDDGYYDDGYASNEYSQEPVQAQYDSNGNSPVSQVQSVLAGDGYYHGSIDGSFGPETRNALIRYQRDHRLAVSGRIDGPVLAALRLR